MTNNLQLVHLSRLDVDFSIGVAFSRAYLIYFDQAKIYSKFKKFRCQGSFNARKSLQTLTPLKKGSFSGLPLGFEETSKKKRGK